MAASNNADKDPTLQKEKNTDVGRSEVTPSTPPYTPRDLESRKSKRVSTWMFDQVDTKHGDLLLFACCFVQGLLDCTAFKNWAVFIGMQTGNTVILCLSTADLPQGQPWAFGTTLISIASFIVGVFTTTRLCVRFSPSRRLTLALNVLAQTLLIFVTAALVTAETPFIPTDADEDPHALLTNSQIMAGIAPLAFQSGMTIATSRMMGLGNEIPVTVYTSTYAALAGDPKLFEWPLGKNKPRNRRLGAVVSVFGGALVATWVEHRSIGMLAILWMAAGIKACLAVTVLIALPRKR
ncbi:MAG: hypothetical protein Q9159_006708 [Coniocarpon cinnabarinum]